MVKSDIFNITDKLRIDEEIKKYEEYEFTPSVNSNLNLGEIRIFIENSDSLFHPHESYLEIEGRLVKADGTAYANTDAITLTHNGLLHLFERIEYRFYDSVVESVSYPGIATTMLGMLKYPNDYQQSKAMNQLWFKDNTTTAIYIPLRHIFGFCDDYDKVFYGLKHELFLLRRNDDNAIFRDAGVAAGKVNITRISLMMRRATPSDVANLQLVKIIKSQETLDMGFRSREGNQEQNSSIFDHCDLKNMWIELNEERYPATNYSLSFPKMKITRAYRHASNFAEDYYNMSNLISLCNITPVDYKSLYPIMYFDVSKQSERMKDSTVDIRLKAEFNTPVPANTKKSAGRPKFLPTKEKERDPKYDYLATIRTDPWEIKLTNIETGEVKNYKSFYAYNKKEKRSKTYIFSKNGKIVDGVKIEIIRASKEKDVLSQK
ncbi:uncharacterized protein LOC136094334 [Hydra vulgaris]|uniref:uncharacterized protein LOC136094334 n=1 Tax=Hydra vulgaris TaxID=6087 RepID=UPI0032EA6B8C